MSELARQRPFGRYAGYVSRLAGFAIDSVILTVVTVAATWAAVSMLLYVGVDVRNCPEPRRAFDLASILCEAALLIGVGLGAALPAIYTVFFWSTTGQTPGKAAMGLRVVRLDGKPMHLWTALVRIAGYGVSLSLFGTGFLWILADDRRQGLADKLAGTCVIYTWEELRD